MCTLRASLLSFLGLIIISQTLHGEAAAKPRSFRENEIVKTETGAYFLIRLGYKFRIADPESLKIYLKNKGSYTKVAKSMLVDYDDGGNAPKLKYLSASIYLEEGEKNKTINIPVGWKYVSHKLKSWKANGGKKKISLVKDNGEINRVVLSIIAYGDTRTFYGTYWGRKTKENQKQQGAKVTILVEQIKEIIHHKDVD